MGLIEFIVKEEGHIYSLDAFDDVLYTCTDNKTIRVWKNLKEFSGFKTKIGLVKAIIVLDDLVFTDHQDGKIHCWKVLSSNPSVIRRHESFSNFIDFLKGSFKLKNYVEVQEKKCSWDKTMKVWWISNFKCLEFVEDAHDDAINFVVVGFNYVVFTDSVDRTVKAWNREFLEK
ncbi:proteasome assembly chaperone 2-like [Hibiscus syriacus]|uniref:Proteasome assembly chaperone 2-like n=1 Tax=Hibiscus syriacus TaxID=106335 RepID=A0A6A3D421_HIBSY|nr:proteasome assembly chaperone 2-like [Hibiscus syriacus]